MNGGTCENNACTCAAEFNGVLCSAGEKIVTFVHIMNLTSLSFRDFNSTHSLL